jgi:hypothetical protein
MGADILKADEAYDELPNERTLKIMEEWKEYLIKKNEKSNKNNGLIVREIKALERVINLIKIIQNDEPRRRALNLTHKIEHFPIVVEGVKFL